MRNCAYNRFLNEVYDLERLESWMEVPLDKHVCVGLKKAEKATAMNRKSTLPYWPGVIHLTQTQSDRYQTFAAHVAVKEDIARVHLDIHYWNAEPSQS